MSDLFPPVCSVCPVRPDIVCILWISMFREHFLHLVDIICISWISWIYPHFMDIICISHITSYLDRNVCRIIHVYSSSVSDWCITSFPVYNLICFSVNSSFRLDHFVGEYELNRNPILIHVPPFITSVKTPTWRHS